MEGVRFGVARNTAGWSIKHNDGYLGHVRTRAEAMAIARMLADWTAAQGRESRIEVGGAPGERQSFLESS